MEPIWQFSSPIGKPAGVYAQRAGQLLDRISARDGSPLLDVLDGSEGQTGQFTQAPLAQVPLSSCPAQPVAYPGV